MKIVFSGSLRKKRYVLYDALKEMGCSIVALCLLFFTVHSFASHLHTFPVYTACHTAYGQKGRVRSQQIAVNFSRPKSANIVYFTTDDQGVLHIPDKYAHASFNEADIVYNKAIVPGCSTDKLKSSHTLYRGALLRFAGIDCGLIKNCSYSK